MTNRVGVFDDSMATVETALRALQIVVLGAAVPLSLIAVRGYWHAPFGAVLRPLPVAAVGFLVAVGERFLPIGSDLATTIQFAAWTVAVLAVAWASLQFFLVTTERRVLVD